MPDFWRALTRRKANIVDDDLQESKLARVLNAFDLTALGVGSTLGLGVYVLAGSVAYDIAGPAVTISFLIAAIASAFAGSCYAEFAARVPKAGSAYIYSYVTVGEFVAFTIGWNLILEYVIGTASVARGLSGYVDALTDHSMSNVLAKTMPINVSFLGSYPDFLASGVVLVLGALLAFGVKESSFLNNIFTCINLTTVCIVVIAGGIKADPANWSIPSNQVPNGFGNGGFMPYGVAGVMAGAAKCFYGFLGFDVIATTGEEAINPKRNIPLAIVISLVIIFLSYFGISTVLTMMVPYYLQDANAPFPHAFDVVGWPSIKWIVTIGAIFALCTSLLGAMFPMPRVLYAMGKDRILFKSLSMVNDSTRTPIFATIISGSFAALMALAFDLDQLIDMMSIGTLLAYSIVAVCVLVLRYQGDEIEMAAPVKFRATTFLRQLVNSNSCREPNEMSSLITKIGVIIFAALSIMWCSWEKFYYFDSTQGIVGFTIITVLLLLTVVVIAHQPVSKTELSFKVPLVPFIPCLSVFVNLYLMCQLDVFTWVRFLVWLVIGYIIYFAYGIRNSIENVKRQDSGRDFGHSNPAFVSGGVEIRDSRGTT